MGIFKPWAFRSFSRAPSVAGIHIPSLAAAIETTKKVDKKMVFFTIFELIFGQNKHHFLSLKEINTAFY
jgi:hypothetical protein